MSVFDISMGSSIRAVDIYDPSLGSSKDLAKLDHKHQLAIPGEYTFDPLLVSNGDDTNITAVGKYWIDQTLWVEVEVGATFAGALTGGGQMSLNALPFLPADLEGGDGSQCIGTARVTNTGVNSYGFDAILVPSISDFVYFVDRASPQVALTNTSPFTIGNTDTMSIRLRYRRGDI